MATKQPPLAEQYAAKIAVPRCKPSCQRKYWIDSPPAGGVIETHCKKCLTWIGNRPVVGKQGAELATEAAENAEATE